jgi:hypothetical protein
MMHATVRTIAPRAREQTSDYLGAAEVVAVEPTRVVVDVPGAGLARAELAFALPYTPAVGDLLLVIGKGDDLFAIGVLRGAGRTSLSLHGDVDLHAVGGRLRLTGDRGLELRAPEVDVLAGKLRMVADAVLQRFSSVCQRVVDLLSVHAGEAHTLVDGASLAQSRRAAILTEETMTINGSEIHLG